MIKSNLRKEEFILAFGEVPEGYSPSWWGEVWQQAMGAESWLITFFIYTHKAQGSDRKRGDAIHP